MEMDIVQQRVGYAGVMQSGRQLRFPDALGEPRACGTLAEVMFGSKPAYEIRKTWEADAAKNPRGALRMRFSDNHDERRAIARFGEKGALAAQALAFTLDGVPLVYNGMEAGVLQFRNCLRREDSLRKDHNAIVRQPRSPFVQRHTPNRFRGDRTKSLPIRSAKLPRSMVAAMNTERVTLRIVLEEFNHLPIVSTPVPRYECYAA